MSKEHGLPYRIFDDTKPEGSVENPLQSSLPPAEWLNEISDHFNNNGDAQNVYISRNWAVIKVDKDMNFSSPDSGGVYDEPAKILIEALEDTDKKLKGSRNKFG